jgi:hypothetical protein
MDTPAHVPQKLQAPKPIDAERQLMEIKRLFHRSLASWASDVLLLKHARLHCMTWRAADAPAWPTTDTRAA